MNHVFMYLDGDNPMKSFYRNDSYPTSGFCIFSNIDDARRHFFNCHVHDFFAWGSDENINWVTSRLPATPEEFDPKTLDSEFLEKFHRMVVMEIGEEYIMAVPIDILKFDRCGHAILPEVIK